MESKAKPKSSTQLPQPLFENRTSLEKSNPESDTELRDIPILSGYIILYCNILKIQLIVFWILSSVGTRKCSNKIVQKLLNSKYMNIRFIQNSMCQMSQDIPGFSYCEAVMIEISIFLCCIMITLKAGDP